MDNISDKSIRFDKNGVCNYCTEAYARKDLEYFPNNEGKKKLDSILERIKSEMKDKPYDCLVGLSGGLDSSYLALIAARDWGLRILAIHIDDGFNSPVVEDNISKLCDFLSIKLIVLKPDPEQYCDILRSFFIAGVPSLDGPQDNILLAERYRYLEEKRIKYFLSGANFALESILERGEGIPAADGKHIKAIHRKFGTIRLDRLKLTTLFRHYIYNRYFLRVKTIRPLNYIDYNKDVAIKDLQRTVGYTYYDGKHHESILTKFVQAYYLPKKFSIDKRKSHYSSLIVSGQMSRDEALNLLALPLYDESKIESDLELIRKRLNLSKQQFNSIMNAEPKRHRDYPVSILNSLRSIAVKMKKYW
jgi:N-acetyl sugar amidotransferase